ncbi:MAG: NADH-quinone oxidoreductase subunit NuoE [Hyphomicrobiaceae bacterium]
MSVRRLDPNQPESFAFTPDNQAWAEATIAKYPEGKQSSAVIPLLWRAQEQCDGWVPEPAIRVVSDMLDMAYIRVYEVATFYTMFQLSPVGRKAHIQVCGTTPCMLRGAEDLRRVCQARIALHPHQLSEDGEFSWEEVECLGACVNAPMVQIWKDTYEDLTAERLEEIIAAFARGEGDTIKPGPQIDRHFSAPEGGPTTLQAYTTPHVAISVTEDVLVAETVETDAGETRHALAETVQTDATAETADVIDEVEEAIVEPDTTSGDAQSLDKSTVGPDGDSDDDGEGDRPLGLDGPRDGIADNLKLISGVGPKLEGILNELGIYHFEQVASWTAENATWVDNFLSFKGRIEREEWITQAEQLASGEKTEFAKRVDAGDVESSQNDETED